MILGLYLYKLRQSRIVGGAVGVLLVVLAIDAFRTLFENVYFGFYFSSLYGFLPKGIHEVLLHPSLIIIPKLINIIAGILVLVLLIRRWVPREIREREEWIQNLQKSNLKLRESEARYDRVIKGTHDGIWDWNIITDENYFSPQWLELLGYEPGDLENTGAAFFELVHDEDRSLVKKALGVHFEKNTIYDVEFRLRCKPGNYKWVRSRGHATRNSDGIPERMAGSTSDISDRKLAQAQFLAAKDEAENANRAKSEFLASMSHELRTPMNAVLGFAQMLMIDTKNPLSKNQIEHVESILAGGNRLLDLVNDVLDLARIEADRVSLSLEETNANAIIKNCVALMVPQGGLRDITIIDNFSEGPAKTLQTDPFRFKQVVLNLLSNALKYNKDGGTVTIDGREGGPGFFCISVTDTGIGIAKKDFAGLFQMFHRIGADPALTRTGTGIGLTVSKQLVERMAGRIGFESEEGVGSSFWIEMPLASNKEILIWSDSLSVGVDALDKDHQTIIKLMNRAAHRFRDNIDMTEIVEELVNYTRYHFRREEMIMKICGYPKLEEHRKHHYELADSMNRLADNWHKHHNPEILHKLHEFLREWWIRHILDVDREIGLYTKGKEQKIRNLLAPLD